MIQGVLFDWPTAAYLLWASLLFALCYSSLYTYRKQQLEKFASAATRSRVTLTRSPLFFSLWVAALAGAWVAATMALMQPKGHGRYHLTTPLSTTPSLKILERTGETAVAVRRKMHDLVFLVDASASMGATDTGEGKSRLEVAKDIAEAVVSFLQGERASLDAFTSQVTFLVPPTQDYLFLRLRVRQLVMNEGDSSGTDFSQALEVLKKRHLNLSEVTKTVILLSDGGDTTLEPLTGQQRELEIQRLTAPLDDFETLQAHLFAVGIGSKEGGVVPGVLFQGNPVHSSLQEDFLIRLGEKGRGEYYFSNGLSSLSIARDIVEKMNRYAPPDELVTTTVPSVRTEAPSQAESKVIYDYYFQLPLGIAILLLTGVWLTSQAPPRRNIE